MNDLERKILINRCDNLAQENLQLREIVNVMTNECLKLRSENKSLETKYIELENYYENLRQVSKQCDVLMKENRELIRGKGEH